MREVIGGWLVCAAVAAGCLTLLTAAAPGRGGPPEALISPDPVATVAAADAYHAQAHRRGRC